MKIALICPRFTGPFGGERLVLKLSESLKDLGNEVTIYTRFFDKSLNSIKSNEVKVSQAGIMNNFGSHQVKNILDMILMPILSRRVKRGYDIVIGSGWQSAYALLWLIFLRKYKKNQTIYYCLEPPRFLYDLKTESLKNISFFKRIIFLPLFFLIKILDRISVSRIGKVVSISEWTKNQCINIYGTNSKVIQPGVEITRFQGTSRESARDKLILDKINPIYLTVTKIHPRKNLEKSVDIYLKTKSPQSSYYIIGDGSYKSSLEKYIDNNSSAKDNIKLLGRLTDNQVTLYMQAANYFIFTAINEPFGIAPLEAQVAGCKVIPKEPIYTPQSWNQVAKNFLKSLK
jgi:hypothetical protein